MRLRIACCAIASTCLVLGAITAFAADPAIDAELDNAEANADDGPVIATSAKKLAFHGLKPGTHRIRVALVGNDHKLVGPEETVTVMIPTAVVAH